MADKRVSRREGPRFYGWIVVAAASAVMMVMSGALFCFGVFFEPVATAFGWTRALISGAFTLSFVVQGLVGILMGKINDRFGPRTVITICGLQGGAGYLLMSQLAAVWQLYVFYGLMVGGGMGGLWVALSSTAARWFLRRRGMATGIMTAGASMGILVVPPLASHLIQVYEWRTAFFILGTAVVVFVVSMAQLLKRDPYQIGQLPLGSEQGQRPHRPTGQGYTLAETVKTRQFWHVAIAFFCSGFCIFMISVHAVPHALDLGVKPIQAATLMTSMGAANTVGRLGLGSAADRIGNRNGILASFAILTIAWIWLVNASAIETLHIAVVGFGLAHGGHASLFSPLVASLFGLRAHGVILGFVYIGFAFGAGLGPLIAGYTFDLTLGYGLAFLVGTGAGIVGLVLTLFTKPMGNGAAR
jgi:MFS family permease